MSNKIEDLAPHMQTLVHMGLAKIKSDGIVKVVVTSTYRTVEEQQALYAQGRTELGEIVTNCDGIKIKSSHQSGYAIDIVPVDKDGNPEWPDLNDGRWRVIASAMCAQGLEWGGDWADFPDYPHYQMKGKV